MRMIQSIVTAVALGFAACAHAGTIAERSPFVQGNWWNPDRSGSGLEIFNSGDQTMVIWYTYDTVGKPVWYTAQGLTSSLGKDPWALLQHRWANGRKADAAQVGTLKLTFKHVQAADADFTINGATGKWSIQPFVATAMLGDVDHSGSWYDPTNSGWGFSVIQQAEVLGGALFTYDAAGNPTWVSGFERGTNSIEYFLYVGTCPTCTYKPFTTQSVGRLTFDFQDEYHATVRSALTLPMAAGVKVDGAHVMQFSRPMSFRAVDRELASFADDAALKAFLQAGILNAGAPASPGGFSAGSPSAAPYSTTNLQESGVDEADAVKNTSSAIYTFAYGSYGSLQPSLRIAQVGGLGLSLGPVTTVALSADAGQSLAYGGLYVDDGVLVAITASQPYVYGGISPWSIPGGWVAGRTFVEIFDTSAATPQSQWTAQLDGHLVASRRIGNRLYLVTRWSPAPPPGFTYYALSGSTSETKNREIVASMTLADLVPAVRVNGAGPTRAVATKDLFVPPQGMRTPSADTVVVTAIDLAKRQIAQALAIAGRAESVYVSPSNLYLVSTRYELRNASGAMTTFDPYGAASDIHQIRLGADSMSFVASGSVDGVIGTSLERAPFQLSEDTGRLRVVSQSNGIWGASSKNRLTILEPAVTTAGTVLKSVSYIPSIWRPEPIGKPGEFLHGTRFAGDRLYAVTFKNIDPLYVVDLSDASAPRIAGQLEVPGFADYLHPLPNGLLLGFGKEAVPAGGVADGQFAWYQGLMLALYDVSNPAQIRELDRAVIGKRGSDSAVLRDHHAFTTMAIRNSTTVAFPARINESPTVSQNPSYFHPWAASGLVRYEVRGTTPQDAVLVEMQNLFTHTMQTGPPQNDAASSNGRAVLYPNSTFYVANGQIWRLDAFGNSTGPF
ncbi:MAG: beta-propeller domain-containing protein [Burkholderiales bacterium]|nr:beta-propeller domain-containing protein [Burkholderiales bacterium]